MFTNEKPGGHGERLVHLGHQFAVAARFVAHEHHRGDVQGELLHRRIQQEAGVVGHPVVGDPIAGEHALCHTGQKHRMPLQPLGPVHGEQFHRIGVAGHRLIEADAVFALGVQVGQQPAERRTQRRRVAADGP